MKFKYIVLLLRGTETPVLSPIDGELVAGDLARAGHVNSAGHCEFQDGEWTATSDVSSPRFKSRQSHDAELIRRSFGAPLHRPPLV